MIVPEHYRYKLPVYNNVLALCSPSKLFMKYDAVYFNFLIINEEEFDKFRNYKIIKMTVTDSELDSLECEYNIIKKRFTEYYAESLKSGLNIKYTSEVSLQTDLCAKDIDDTKCAKDIDDTPFVNLDDDPYVNIDKSYHNWSDNESDNKWSEKTDQNMSDNESDNNSSDNESDSESSVDDNYHKDLMADPLIDYDKGQHCEADSLSHDIKPSVPDNIDIVLNDNVTMPDNNNDGFDKNHGMTISSAFSGINKEERQRKLEEIMKRNHASMKQRCIENKWAAIYEETYEERIAEHIRKYRYDSYIRESMYSFPVKFEYQKISQPKNWEFDIPKRKEDAPSTCEYSSDMCCDSDSSDTIFSDKEENSEPIVYNNLADFRSKARVPRWHMSKIDAFDNMPPITSKDIEVFFDNLDNKRFILYDINEVDFYKVNFSKRDDFGKIRNCCLHGYNSDASDASGASDVENTEEGSEEYSDEYSNEYSDGSNSCNTKKYYKYYEYNKLSTYAMEEIEFFIERNAIEFVMPMDIYKDDPLIHKYLFYIYNLIHKFYDKTPTIDDNQKRQLKDYVSYKLGTDKFFNFNIEKSSDIYRKYRTFHIRPPTFRKYTFDPNNMIPWMIPRHKNIATLSENYYNILKKNKLFTMFALYYVLTVSDQPHYLQFLCMPMAVDLQVAVIKYTVETLKIWEKHKNVFTLKTSPID